MLTDVKRIAPIVAIIINQSRAQVLFLYSGLLVLIIELLD